MADSYDDIMRSASMFGGNDKPRILARAVINMRRAIDIRTKWPIFD